MGFESQIWNTIKDKIVFELPFEPKKIDYYKESYKLGVFFSSIKLGSYPWDKAYKPSSNILPNQLSFIFF